MAEYSKIEWTHHTFNPWMGCQKVSEACKFCYAEKETPVRVLRGRGVELWGAVAARVKTSDATWAKPRQWNKRAGEMGERQRVFCASLADVFEDRDELDVLRSWLFQMIQETPNLDWLLLTKRPENIMRSIQTVRDLGGPAREMASSWLNGYPKKNIWIGTTVENQEQAAKRIPELLKIPADVRFLSCEPLLGPVDLTSVGPEQWDVLHGWKPANDQYPEGANTSCIDWVICGGESGSHARPMHPDWARSLRDQCQRAGVPFLFKQWGEYWPGEVGRLYREKTIDFTDGQPMVKVGKIQAGRLLDGKIYHGFPEVKK